MKKSIENHPTITHANDLAEICRPLSKLGITYFSHVNINEKGFSGVANNPDFHRHYLTNEYYNADIHMGNSGLLKDYIVWDAIEIQGESKKLDEESHAFGVKHTFTMIEKNNSGDNYYHFASNLSDNSINQVYLNNVDLLKLFVLSFKEKVNRSKQLAAGYDIRFQLTDGSDRAIFNPSMVSVEASIMRKQFIGELNLSDKFPLANGKALTPRQLQILYWLHQGKSISDISSILEIADITVNKHIAAIKKTLSCYTQFQLGEYFSELFGHSPELINILLKL